MKKKVIFNKPKAQSISPRIFKNQIQWEMSLEESVGTWLVALEDPEKITRFRNIKSLANELEYLTEIPEGSGVGVILSAIAKGSTEVRLKAARDVMLSTKMSRDRLRQIMWRMMKLLRRSDRDVTRRRSLFQDLLCMSDFSPAHTSNAIILPLCRYEQSLSSPRHYEK